MAHETSLVGNIGVIAEFVCVKELFNKIGVDVNIIKSNTFDGRESVKDMGTPFRTMKPKEKKIFQDMINEMWNRFVDVVAEGRKKVLTRDQVAKLADGSIYTGKGAKEKKLVDECGFKEDAFNKVKQMANLSDAKLVRYKYRYSPLSELLGAKFKGENTIQIGPDFKELIHDRSPRLMYLWTTE
jgi:protease-4